MLTPRLAIMNMLVTFSQVFVMHIYSMSLNMIFFFSCLAASNGEMFDEKVLIHSLTSPLRITRVYSGPCRERWLRRHRTVYYLHFSPTQWWHAIRALDSDTGIWGTAAWSKVQISSRATSFSTAEDDNVVYSSGWEARLPYLHAVKMARFADNPSRAQAFSWVGWAF